MRRLPLKVANASARIAKLKVVKSDDITTHVPKNSLMTKNNTIEAQKEIPTFKKTNWEHDFAFIKNLDTLAIHSPFGNRGGGL